jgi:hypothetical protein
MRLRADIFHSEQLWQVARYTRRLAREHQQHCRRQPHPGFPAPTPVPEPPEWPQSPAQAVVICALPGCEDKAGHQGSAAIQSLLSNHLARSFASMPSLP